MFPFFAFGHISPFVQLSNKLSSHGVRISFLTPSGNLQRVQSMLTPSPTTTIIPLTLPPVQGLPPGVESTADTSPATAELLKVALDLMQPQINSLLVDLKPHFVLFDFAQGWLPPMARKLGIKTIYFSVFMASSTAFLAVTARLGQQTSTVSATVEDIKNPPPGTLPLLTTVKTFEARDFLYVFKSFHGTPSVFDRLMTGFHGCDAILIKSCREMEGAYIDFVTTVFKKPVLLVGPVAPEPLTGKLEEKWESWLSRFPAKSVIYCSFGSEVFLTEDQIKELALGLELTGLPFFLVLNFPADVVDKSKELERRLPEGFLERVKDKGVVHSGWVQQRHILAHESVGCYVNHAGFSSVTEALMSGCQLVMLPRKADQFMNSKLVVMDWKAGVEINTRDEDGYFGKEDVYDAVRSIMMEVDKEPARSIRANHNKMKQFLHNNEIQKEYIKDLVQNMKAIANI